MRDPNPVRIETGDVVAVRLGAGPAWVDVVAEIWEAHATLVPIDVRLPEPAADSLVRSARPTIELDELGRRRRDDGERADPTVALVAHTSGTGGEPKLCEFSRSAVEAAVAASTETLGASARDRWLCCLPPAHVGGLLVLLRAVLLGAPVTAHERFEPERFAAVRDVAFTSVVPTMLRRLLDADVDLGRLRGVLVGGARLDAGLRARAETASAHVIETYGLTESLGGVVYDGRPFAGTSMRIAAGDEIELRGPTLMRAYRSGAGSSRDALSEGGWLRTGDVGTIDDEGRLRVIGRLDGLITSGGERVWPEEVEAALAGHPKIAEVAVAGRPDPEWGERVVAVVVPADPAEPPTLEELRRAASAHLPRYKAPRELVLAAALPRTPSGKVGRAALAAELARPE